MLGWLGLVAASGIANADFHRRFQSSIRCAPSLDAITQAPEHLPSLSVVVPVYNESANIADCLEAILTSGWPDGSVLQVIVADDESTDNTKALADEVADRWDGEALRRQIIATQKSRRALHAAMEAGASEPWDYNPPRDASQAYVRNHMDWTAAAKRYRYPPLKDHTE